MNVSVGIGYHLSLVLVLHSTIDITGMRHNFLNCFSSETEQTLSINILFGLKKQDEFMNFIIRFGN